MSSKLRYLQNSQHIVSNRIYNEQIQTISADISSFLLLVDPKCLLVYVIADLHPQCHHTHEPEDRVDYVDGQVDLGQLFSHHVYCLAVVSACVTHEHHHFSDGHGYEGANPDKKDGPADVLVEVGEHVHQINGQVGHRYDQVDDAGGNIESLEVLGPVEAEKQEDPDQVARRVGVPECEVVLTPQGQQGQNDHTQGLESNEPVHNFVVSAAVGLANAEKPHQHHDPYQNQVDAQPHQKQLVVEHLGALDDGQPDGVVEEQNDGKGLIHASHVGRAVSAVYPGDDLAEQGLDGELEEPHMATE